MEDTLMLQIYKAIYQAITEKLYLIGSVIDGDARRLTLELGIYDKGDFYDNIGFLVETKAEGMTLRVGSNIKHEPFVLGGKVPSWTPLEPLKSWVERKHLAWIDRKTGTPLTVTEIAYLIRNKIKREGIKERNVFQMILDKKEEWIYSQLNSIEVRL